MDVVESDFALGDMEGGIELLNGLTVGGSIGEMDLSLAVRIGEGAGGLHEKIGLAGDGIVVSGESLRGERDRRCGGWRARLKVLSPVKWPCWSVAEASNSAEVSSRRSVAL